MSILIALNHTDKPLNFSLYDESPYSIQLHLDILNDLKFKMKSSMHLELDLFECAPTSG